LDARDANGPGGDPPADQDLLVRLIAASGRVEATLFETPMTLADATFRLIWADALLTLAENVFAENRERFGNFTLETGKRTKNLPALQYRP
jgi:hypothetical protein